LNILKSFTSCPFQAFRSGQKGRLGGGFAGECVFCGRKFLPHQQNSTMTTMEQIEATLARIGEYQAQSVLSLEAFKAQLAASQEAADRRAVEADRRAVEADRRAMEADRRAAEADRHAAESKKETEALRQSIADTDRQVKELGRQIGGLGNKFGSFTEGLLLPSVGKILAEYFGATNFLPRIRARRNGREFEADAFAYSNGEKNLGVVMEIKSDAEVRHIKQLRQTMEDLPVFYPEFAHLRLQGLFTAVDGITAEVRREAERAGIFVAVITDDMLEFTPPDDSFEPFTIMPQQ
jgi:hypothetical protein